MKKLILLFAAFWLLSQGCGNPESFSGVNEDGVASAPASPATSQVAIDVKTATSEGRASQALTTEAAGTTKDVYVYPACAYCAASGCVWNGAQCVYPTTGYYNPYGYNPYGYNPYGYNPYGYNPYGYNPYGYNPYGYNPYGYNPYGYNPYGYRANCRYYTTYANCVSAGCLWGTTATSWGSYCY